MKKTKKTKKQPRARFVSRRLVGVVATSSISFQALYEATYCFEDKNALRYFSRLERGANVQVDTLPDAAALVLAKIPIDADLEGRCLAVDSASPQCRVGNSNDGAEGAAFILDSFNG